MDGVWWTSGAAGRLGVSQAELGVLIDDGSRRTLVLPSMVPNIDALPPVDHLVLGARDLGIRHAVDGVLEALVQAQEIRAARLFGSKRWRLVSWCWMP